jgi:hypothetical protein
MTIEIGNIVIICDICLCEREGKATPRITSASPIPSWSANDAILNWRREGWMIDGENANCPSCFEKQLGSMQA